MSTFLPDHFGTTDKYQSFTTSDQTFNEADGHLLHRVFARPQLIPNPFWSYLVDYVAVNQPSIPISQIIGFAQAVPPGMIVDYGGATSPRGWLVCDGTAVGRKTYPALFALANRSAKHRHTGHSHSSGQGSIYASSVTGSTADTVAKGSTANVPSITVNSVSVPSADGGSGIASDPLDAPAYLVVTRIIKT